MPSYQELQARLDKGEVIILDGAIGSEINRMGAPLDSTSWAGMALLTHPDTIRLMHMRYISAGADILTTNTYSSARHNLEPLGFSDRVKELNLRATVLAQEARDRIPADRPVYVGGAVSTYGIVTESEYPLYAGRRGGGGFLRRQYITADQAKANLREQAEILADGGVDFLIGESTGNVTQRKWISEALASTGLPFWVGFKTHVDSADNQVKVGYASPDLFADGLDEVLPLGGSLVSIFHTSMDDTEASLPTLLEKWSGPVAVYAEDYGPAAFGERPQNVTPEQHLEAAKRWVSQGVQIIGTCCGLGVEFIEPLRDGLPTHIPSPRKA